jgi:hypothetical protein
MDNYQATYNNRWPNQPLLSVHVFTFVGSRPPQHSWPAAATPNHDEMLDFGWMIDYILAKQISLELPSHIFIVGLSTRFGEQPDCDST